MSDPNQVLQQIVAAQLAALPPVVRKAIESSEIQVNLRKLSESYKLHIDQWESLEEVVMMTLLGVDQIEDLQQNIVREVGVDNEVARNLAENVNTIVFEPIREELERQLEHPEAQEKQFSGVEAARNQEIASAQAEATPVAAAAPAQPTPPSVQPATPPPPVPDVKVARPSDDSNYKPGETSAQRATVHDDPYREPPV